MELQDAITQAMAFARQALDRPLSVEEIEFQDSSPAWRITVGYKRALPEKQRASDDKPASIADRIRSQNQYIEFEDVYKTIIVPENGGSISMKIRKI